METTTAARAPREILVACAVPWDERFELEEERFREQVRLAVADGFRRLYVFGTAGEGYAVDTARFRAVVRAFVDEAHRRGLDTLPGMFGVFYYRSANPKTLEVLSRFLPVPVGALADEFAAGATPVDVCARTLRAMIDIGARHFYISNLPLLNASSTLNAILERVGALA